MCRYTFSPHFLKPPLLSNKCVLTYQTVLLSITSSAVSCSTRLLSLSSPHVVLLSPCFAIYFPPSACLSSSFCPCLAGTHVPSVSSPFLASQSPCPRLLQQIDRSSLALCVFDSHTERQTKTTKQAVCVCFSRCGRPPPRHSSCQVLCQAVLNTQRKSHTLFFLFVSSLRFTF